MSNKWRTAYNYTPVKGELNTKPSKTIPDQTMSIKELMDRYARGLPLSGTNRVPIYDGDDDILQGVNPATLDISERINLIRDVQDEIQEIQQKTSEKQQKAKTAAQHAAWRKQMEQENQQHEKTEQQKD